MPELVDAAPASALAVYAHPDDAEISCGGTLARWATLDAVAPAAAMPHYFPDAGDVHRVGCIYLSGTLEPNVWVDVSDALDAKIDALFCHRSQLADTSEFFRGFLRERAEEAGRQAGVRYAEGFRRLTLV